MGYYTQFELDVKQNILTPLPEAARIHVIGAFCASNENARYCLDDDGSSNERGKWYSYEKDLAAFSLNFPAYLFILSGEGEESGDVWRLYVQNGMAQEAKAELVFPDFDPAKMERKADIPSQVVVPIDHVEAARQTALAKLTPNELAALGLSAPAPLPTQKGGA